MDINEFQDYVKDKPQIDIKLDSSFSDKCNLHSNLIIDWRLGFHFVKNSFNVFLKVSKETAAQRLKLANRIDEFQDDNIELILQKSKDRNSKMRERFITLYNVDFADETNYDLVLDTDNLTISNEFDTIIDKIKG